METEGAQPEYLVIVPRDRRDLVDHLRHQYADDPRIRVVHDRRALRREPIERRPEQLRKSPDFEKVLRAADVVIICRALKARADDAPGLAPARAGRGGQGTVENEQMTGTQFRPLIERTQHLLGGLAQLLDEHDEMQAEARRAAEERESLRREIQELQRDNENLRNRGEALWREHQALLEERNDLLRERETLLSERERISAGLSKFMREVVQPMNAPRSAVNG